MSKFCMETASPLVKAAYNLTIAALGESAREEVPKIINIDKIIECIEYNRTDSPYAHDDDRRPVQTRVFWRALVILKFTPDYVEAIRSNTTSPQFATETAARVIAENVLDYLPILDKESVREDCISVVISHLRQSEEMVA